MKEIRWHGRGGQGAFTASKLLGAAATLEGKYALAFPSFGPERRGAPIQAFTKIDDQPITDRSVVKKCDYMLFLDETLYSEHLAKDLKEEGKIIINSQNPDKYESPQVIAFNASQIAEEILKRPVTNTALLAAFAVISKAVSLEEIESVLGLYLPNKIAEKNKEVIKRVAKELEKRRAL